MTFLQKSSESLDTELVKLVKQAENFKDAPSLKSRANALKCKSEGQQSEHKKLEKSINILDEKRKKLNFLKIFALIC